jgi:hypothetical protein
MTYDTWTETAGLLLDNERRSNEAAHTLTSMACSSIVLAQIAHTDTSTDRDRVGEETHGIVSLLADGLRNTVENHPDINEALEGRLAATFVSDFVRRGLDAVDWLQLARDWINEQRIQDGTEPLPEAEPAREVTP